jgi:type II secretory pathway component GspD/PulD (secretin)
VHLLNFIGKDSRASLKRGSGLPELSIANMLQNEISADSGKIKGKVRFLSQHTSISILIPPSIATLHC